MVKAFSYEGARFPGVSVYLSGIRKKEKKTFFFSFFDIRELRHLIVQTSNYFCRNMHPVTMASHFTIYYAKQISDVIQDILYGL